MIRASEAQRENQRVVEAQSMKAVAEPTIASGIPKTIILSQRDFMIKFVRKDAVLGMKAGLTGHTSDGLTEEYWKKHHSIDSLIAADQFFNIPFSNIKTFQYNVITYTWKTLWSSIIEGLESHSDKLADYFWIDVLCLPQYTADDDKMSTIHNSNLIYKYARNYLVFENPVAHDVLSRGWCLYELAAAGQLPCFVNFPTATLPLSLNFDDCKFSFEQDRLFVRNSISVEYGPISNFNKKVSDLFRLLPPSATAPVPHDTERSVRITAMEKWLKENADLTSAARAKYAIAFYDADVSSMAKVAKHLKKNPQWLLLAGVSEIDADEITEALAALRV